MKGIAASPGIVIGKALLFRKGEVIYSKTRIEEDEVKYELERLKQAKEQTKKQLIKIYEDSRKRFGEDKAKIFEAQLLLIDDLMLGQKINEYIEDKLFAAETAIDMAMEEVSQLFESLEDKYLQERVADVIDLCTRMVYTLAGVEIVNLRDLEEEVIIVAKDLTPSDTAQINVSKLLGFATDVGGKTAHTSIMARMLEIPAVVGLKEISSKVKNNDTLILDGNNGVVIINPTESELEEYRQKQATFLDEKKKLEKMVDLEAVTLDGRKVELAANIGMPGDVEGIIRNGARAIGLYRTEFLYMDHSSMPTEDEQFEAYKEVAVRMRNKPIIIRTLDVGGDKEIPYLKCPHEMNPFLGWRAIRLCLEKKDLFRTQLRAILRASTYGKLRIMYPMITHLEQVRAARKILEEVKDELRSGKIEYDENIEVGIMIETPAAAMIADLLIKEVDFFSIGTNDLTQYTIAVDRGNEKINNLYNSFHPSVLRLIKMVIDAAHDAGKWIGMCGEFAGDEKATLLLLGLGLDEFSMSSISILAIKQLIRKCNYERAKEISKIVLNLATTAEVEKYLEEQIKAIRMR